MSNDLVAQLTTNVNVGMDEVVSVFVAQFESNLFARKNELQTSIKELKQARKVTAAEIAGRVDVSVYAVTNKVLGIEAAVEKIQIDWEGNRNVKPAVVVSVEIKDTDDSNRYSSSFDKNFRTNLTKADLASRKKSTDELTDLGDQLTDVMTQIKTINRKERQVRGRIAEMKLKESGFEGLLQNEEMMKLVTLD